MFGRVLAPVVLHPLQNGVDNLGSVYSEFVCLFIFILSVMFVLALYLSCLVVRICSLCSHGLFACHLACHKLYAVFLGLYYIVVFYTFCVFLF